jgi:hypothetical protein
MITKTTNTKKYTALQSSFLHQAVAYLSNEARKCQLAEDSYPLHDASQHKHDWMASRYACLEGIAALQGVIDQEQFNG